MNSYHLNLAPKTSPGASAPRASHSLALPAAVIAAVGVAMSLCMAGNIAAAGLACKPDFKITNDKSRAVKVLSLVYQVGGREHTECLNNRKLAPGEESMWKSQSFGKLAEGNAMEKIRIEYRNDTSGEGKIISDPWGPAVKTIWFTTEVEGDCKNDRTYELRIP